MRIENLHPRILLAAGGIFFALLTGVQQANAQNIAVLVNDEPITSGDVAQRIRWNARTNGFGDRMKAILTGRLYQRALPADDGSGKSSFAGRG